MQDTATRPARLPANSGQVSDTKMELANRLFFRLYQCANMLHKTGTRAVEAEGLTTQQWAVLGARDGHVAIGPDGRDGRSRRVVMTSPGRRLWLQRAQPKIRAYYEDVLGDFSVNDLTHALHYLLKILQQMQRIDAARGTADGEGEAGDGVEAAPVLRPRARTTTGSGPRPPAPAARPGRRTPR